VQVPATTIDRQHAQIVQVEVSLHVSLLQVRRIDPVQPVASGDRRSDAEVESLERVIHVAVLVDTPIGPLQVVVDQSVRIQQRLLLFIRIALSLPIEDIGLGDLRVS